MQPTSSFIRRYVFRWHSVILSYREIHTLLNYENHENHWGDWANYNSYMSVATEINSWLKNNCIGKYQSMRDTFSTGREFLFQKTEDAVMFKLVWSSRGN